METRQTLPFNYDVIDIKKEFKEKTTLLLLSRGILLSYSKGIIYVYDVSDFLLRTEIKNIHHLTKNDDIRKVMEVTFLNL